MKEVAKPQKKILPDFEYMKQSHFINEDYVKQPKKSRSATKSELKRSTTVRVSKKGSARQVFRIRVNIVLAFVNILKEIRRKTERRDKLEVLRKGLHKHGVDRQEKELLASRATVSEQLKVSSTKITRLSTHKKLIQCNSSIRNYVVSKPEERVLLEGVLDILLSKEDRKANPEFRRIVWLTRALLNQPDLLLIDENALILPKPVDDYLPAVLEHLSDTSIVCRLTSGRLVNYFNKKYIFTRGNLQEY